MSRKDQDYDEPDWKPWKRSEPRGCVLCFALLGGLLMLLAEWSVR